MESFNALVLSLPTRNSTLRMRVWRGLKETGWRRAARRRLPPAHERDRRTVLARRVGDPPNAASR